MVLAGLSVFLLEVNAAMAENSQVVEAGRGVLVRLLGPRAGDFVLEAIPEDDGHPVYEVQASGGKVTVRGSSGAAIARGAYDYLRSACNCMVTWSGSHLPLPRQFPDCANKRVVCPYRFVQYYNACAFGYSTAFWDWQRWEREIDWMALHGINMPLAMEGQEAIWRRLWKSYGITDEELKEHFVGPAHLPWQRMGNINHHDGPLPEGWIDQKRLLQRKLLDRMRELGMKPIVPGFGGHVPAAFKRVKPEATVFTLDANHWAQMPQADNTYVLSPGESDLFIEIGRRFIQEYRKEYGPVQYYLADAFNEMEVPVTKEGRYQELAQYGQTIYKSVLAGDPEGTWVMQGWLFYFGRHFWDKASAQALLKNVPDDRMIVIDLANEQYPGWANHDAFYGKQWIYSIVHNFGGNNTLWGQLPFFAEDPSKALHSPKRGKLVGFGISPEGIENNEVVYELLADVSWRGEAVDLKSWLRGYCRARYGDCPAKMAQAWDLLVQTIYGQPRAARYRWQRRPNLHWFSTVRSRPKFTQAVELFLSCRDQLKDSILYKNDAVELTAQAVGAEADRLLQEAAQLDLAGQTDKSDRFAESAFSELEQMDRLISWRPDMRLERWLTDARRWSQDAKEKDYYESNARRQVTVWGGDLLSEYASKVWSGLIRDYYVPRWKQTLQARRAGKQFDVLAWEEKWITTPGGLSAMKPPEDPLAEAQRLVEQIRRLPRADELKGIFGIAVGKPVAASAVSRKHHRMRPERAVDGDANDCQRGWWADESPAWLRIDLSDDPNAADYAAAMGDPQTKSIDRVDVFTYWDGKRYYQYTVEVSPDGKDWKQAVDMSHNEKPATPEGDQHRFSPVEARFVRVNMLKNSAGPEVHLTEVRVFEAE